MAEHGTGSVRTKSGPRRRPIADFVAEIERESPGLAESMGISSAALRAGDLIRWMRRAAGLSQHGLAGRMAITQGRVSELEAGLGPQGPTWDVMTRAAEACGTEFRFVPVAGSTEDALVSATGDALVEAGLPRDRLRVVDVDGRRCLALDVGDGRTVHLVAVGAVDRAEPGS